MKTKALFVGRFQPLHKGHLHAMRRILQRFDELVVAIGSINKADGGNPFSFGERKQMIRLALGKKLMKRARVIGVPDVGKDKKWAKSIAEKMDFDVVVTGNGWVRRCF